MLVPAGARTTPSAPGPSMDGPGALGANDGRYAATGTLTGSASRTSSSTGDEEAEL